MKILNWLFGKRESKEDKKDEESMVRIEATLKRMDKLFDQMEMDHEETKRIFEKAMNKPARKERNLKLV